MIRRLHLGAALIAGAVALLFIPGWLATGNPILLGLGAVIVSASAYAGWQLINLVSAIRGWNTPGPGQAPPRVLEAPELSKGRAAKVRQIVATLAAEGVFLPEVPLPAQLYPPIADRDEAPNQEVVLTALFEADCYDPAFTPARHMANLAYHDSKAEQFTETIAAQLADLQRLCGDDLEIDAVEIDHQIVRGQGPQPDCTIRFRAAGKPVERRYRPAAKYLSTHLHLAVATALKAQDRGRRLAWLWNDQGCWISTLSDGGVERLNLAVGAVKAGYDGWSWIDEADPIAVGDFDQAID